MQGQRESGVVCSRQNKGLFLPPTVPGRLRRNWPGSQVRVWFIHIAFPYHHHHHLCLFTFLSVCPPRRGNPLHLCLERYRKIERLWQQHAIAEVIGHAQEANQTLVAIDWQHLWLSLGGPIPHLLDQSASCGPALSSDQLQGFFTFVFFFCVWEHKHPQTLRGLPAQIFGPWEPQHNVSADCFLQEPFGETWETGEQVTGSGTEN